MDTQSARNLLASALFLFGVQRVPEKKHAREAEIIVYGTKL